MNVAANPGASKGASAREYPESKPDEVPPRPAWTGADPRVSQRIGAHTHPSLTERHEKGH